MADRWFMLAAVRLMLCYIPLLGFERSGIVVTFVMYVLLCQIFLALAFWQLDFARLFYQSFAIACVSLLAIVYDALKQL